MVPRALPLLALLALLLAPARAAADIVLPAGFTAQVYLTGEGFDSTTRGGRGVPSTSTLALDDAGALYLSRTGRRYVGGEVEDVFPIYRVPVGGGRMTPSTEHRFFHGPPLPNPQVAAIRGGREILVTTFDRDRRIGVLYRLLDGEAMLFAGGTPAAGTPPLLRQPEGAAIDAAGNLYVADREQGVIVQLDAEGRVRDPRWVAVTRPRTLAAGEGGILWVASDGAAEAPWQRGPGEIIRVGPDRELRVVLRGPVPAGMTVGPGGFPFVADRHGAEVFILTADGRRLGFARFTDGDAPRSLAFAPDTPATRRAGFAGDLFVVTINRGAWPVNEVVRISGPFAEHVRRAATP
jgi:hypothetical protein